MPIAVSPPEQRVVLRNVSWETYERLLAENLDHSSPRFTYDRGVLEIMSPSAEHEWYNQLLSDLVKLLPRELRIDVLRLGLYDVSAGGEGAWVRTRLVFLRYPCQAVEGQRTN